MTSGQVDIRKARSTLGRETGCFLLDRGSACGTSVFFEKPVSLIDVRERAL